MIDKDKARDLPDGVALYFKITRSGSVTDLYLKKSTLDNVLYKFEYNDRDEILSLFGTGIEEINLTDDVAYKKTCDRIIVDKETGRYERMIIYGRIFKP